MFNEHVFKGTKLINSSLIFFHIDHLLGHFFSDCFDNHQIMFIDIYMSRYRGLQVLSYFIELSSFHIYLQSPSGWHDVKEKKALN